MGQVIDTDHNLPQELLDFIITTSISPGPIHVSLYTINDLRLHFSYDSKVE